MSNLFHVGQKVVCVRDSDRPWRPDRPVDPLRPLPVNGGVYQIVGIELHPVFANGVGLIFDEFPDAGFCSTSFRPVCTTDISIFTAMLAPTPRVKETA